MSCSAGLDLYGIMTTASIIEAAGRISCFGLETNGSLGINVLSGASKTASISQARAISGASLSVTGVTVSHITMIML